MTKHIQDKCCKRCWNDSEAISYCMNMNCPCHTSQPKEECKHEDLKLVGVIPHQDKCLVCKEGLVANEIEILNMFHEVGGFCDNEKCIRYLLLVV